MQKIFSLLSLFLIIIVQISGQCPGGDSLVKIISSLKGSSTISKAERLKALSRYENGISHCSHEHDSIHALLLREIGNFHAVNNDFLKAIEYYQKSVDLIKRNADKLSINQKDLVSSYFSMAAFNDSLRRISEKMRMYDSCYLIALRLNSIDRNCLRALYSKIQYSFVIGDYHRCMEYSSLCENLGLEYTKRSNNKDDSARGIRYANSSFIWYVNSLLVLKEYDSAETLLLAKSTALEKEHRSNYLGVVYGNLAEVLVFKKDYKNALRYTNSALAIEMDSGVAFNCKAMLNGIGYDFYFNYYKDFKKAKEYYLKALNYKVTAKEELMLSSMESLSILTRIANIFVVTKQYDSALKYFQFDFDQISPG